MYIELIDLLRCPRDHEESWLVAAFGKMDGRFVIEGKLGCHVCSASYAIADGVADLRREVNRPREVPLPTRESGPPVPAEDAVRTAAMLNLTRPDMLLVLADDAARASHVISQISEARVIALNPSDVPEESERVALVLSDDRFPLASASVDGIVLTANSAEALLTDASRVLKPGGRIVTPASAELGPSFRHLARDDRQRVAEATGPLITLSR